MPLKNAANGPGSLKEQADKILGNEENPYQDYDFCHHCKQLKNKYLLVSCKYTQKQNKAVVPGSYTPYPYEP